jgi:hypothetical protein
MGDLTGDSGSDGTDPTDLSPNTTSTDSGGTVAAGQTPSNGLDAADLFSQLLGTAGQAYSANQTAQAQIAAAQAAAPQTTILGSLSSSTGLSSTTLILIGVGLFALALMRK